MTKEEFISNVAEKTGLPHDEAAAAVDAFLASVTEALKNGEEVSFKGFGKFSTRNRTARKGLRQAADELREEAEELGRGHKTFRKNIERSQQTLREIAGAA